MRTVEEQRRAMRNMVGRYGAATFFQMADGTAGRGYRYEINSRDIIDRHAQLSSACDDSIIDHPDDKPIPNVEDCPIHVTDLERDELDQLNDLISQLEGGDGWEQGVDLIAEDDFEDHARDTAAQSGVYLDDWPYSCIDWQQAVFELEADYLQGSVDAGTWFIKI